MEHSAYESKLYEFYDGELAEPEAQELARHLAACRQCQLEIEALNRAKQALSQSLQLSVSPSFSRQVMSRIRQVDRESQASKRSSILDWLGLPRWEIAAACSFSLLIFSYFSFDYLQSRRNGSDNALASAYEHAGAGTWILAKKELGKEDVLEIALGEPIDESDPEVEFDGR